jgi:hypothetical protein
MAQGEELQHGPMKLNGLIKVRHDALLLESVMKTGSKIVEKYGSVGMT